MQIFPHTRRKAVAFHAVSMKAGCKCAVSHIDFISLSTRLTGLACIHGCPDLSCVPASVCLPSAHPRRQSSGTGEGLKNAMGDTPWRTTSLRTARHVTCTPRGSHVSAQGPHLAVPLAERSHTEALTHLFLPAAEPTHRSQRISLCQLL